MCWSFLHWVTPFCKGCLWDLERYGLLNRACLRHGNSLPICLFMQGSATLSLIYLHSGYLVRVLRTTGEPNGLQPIICSQVSGRLSFTCGSAAAGHQPWEPLELFTGFCSLLE